MGGQPWWGFVLFPWKLLGGVVSLVDFGRKMDSISDVLGGGNSKIFWIFHPGSWGR